jgi:hypothetical protein
VCFTLAAAAVSVDCDPGRGQEMRWHQGRARTCCGCEKDKRKKERKKEAKKQRSLREAAEEEEIETDAD